MPATKIIFFDIDGTLIDMQRKQISENTLKVLRQLQKNGIKICLATGRSPVALSCQIAVLFSCIKQFHIQHTDICLYILCYLLPLYKNVIIAPS